MYPQEGPEPWKQFRTDGAGGEIVNYPWVMDTDNRVTVALGVQFLDTKVYFNRQGEVVASTMGIRPEQEIEANVKEILK